MIDSVSPATQATEQAPPNHPKSAAEVILWTAIRAALLGIVGAIEVYLEWKKSKKSN